MAKEISKEDRAYFAGLLDGEGCITISKAVGKYVKYCLCVNFGHTYKAVLIELKDFFSGGISKTNMEKRLKNNSFQVALKAGISSGIRKQSYNYVISGRDALYFLKVVEPYLREKKGQAALGIRYEEGRRPHAGGHGRSDSETQRCEFYYQELQKLKYEDMDEIDDKIDFEDDQKKLCFY